MLAGDVVVGNAANAKYQGQALGNLAAGSSAAKLYRPHRDNGFSAPIFPPSTPMCPPDRRSRTALPPVRCSTARPPTSMKSRACSATVTLFGPGQRRRPLARRLENMFLDNGDGTWTVRFYANGVADYVTVNRMLPTSSGGYLVYADYCSMYNNSANTLWIALVEKAYAQWNQTGKEGRDGTNTYSGIQGGDPADVFPRCLAIAPAATR